MKRLGLLLKGKKLKKKVEEKIPVKAKLEDAYLLVLVAVFVVVGVGIVLFILRKKFY